MVIFKFITDRESKIENIIEKITLYFIGLQVVIDLLTTLSVRVLHIDISFGMFIRFAFLGFSILYLVCFGSKKVRLVGALLAIMFAGQLIYTIFLEDAAFFMNCRFYLRSAVFPFSALFFYCWFSRADERNRKARIHSIVNILNVIIFLIGIVSLLSTVTGTYFPMYPTDDGRLGSSGWFLSGNELSSTMIILSGIPSFCYYQNRNNFTFINLILQMLVIVLLGTKSSLFVLLIVTGMICYTFGLCIKEKKYRITHTVIMLMIILALIVCNGFIPSVQNIKTQAELQQNISMQSSLKEGDPIPEKIAAKHDRAVEQNTGDYIGSVRLNFEADTVEVSGYFYPCYADLGHPDYVKKELILIDSVGKKIEVPLADTYNRYIENPEEDRYSSVFAGLKGSLASKILDREEQYSILMLIETSSFVRTYTIKQDVSVTNKNFTRNVSFQNGVLSVGNKKAPSSTPPTQPQQSETGYSMWLSARDTRLANLIAEKGSFSISEFLFGTGYVANYADLNGGTGLEMDFIEIFLTFGLLGGFLYFILYGFLILKGIYNIIKRSNFSMVFQPAFILFIIPILLSAGAAFLAGHTFLTPSVSIDVAIIVVLFYYIQRDWSSRGEGNKCS